MVTRRNGGVDVVFRVPSWSERWVLEDGVTMPETSEHRLTCELLEMILRAWIARTGRDAAVYANLALRWDEEHPAVGVDPDVCLVDPTPPDAKLRSLRTWEPGHAAPRVAVEVVSRDTAEKDYFEGPAKYAASGTRELWVFDPERRGRGALGPSVLQVWRRMDDGAFRRVFAGDAPAYSDELGAWLVVTDDGTRLRLADDEAGERRWLTGEEAARAQAQADRERAQAERAQAQAERERAQAERERAQAERERAQAERERADALAERIAALEAQLNASDALPRGPSSAR
jgi:Uma2 family endonuclease